MCVRTVQLAIWDNGAGMTKEELRRWATMGISQSDSADATTLQPQDDQHGRNVTGLISRYVFLCHYKWS